MADNVTIPTTGSGTATPVIATDDVASVHYQKVKIALGADGAIDTLVDSGQQTMADSIPVAIASNQTAVPVSASSLPLPTGASTLAEQQSQTTALQIMDDWDESDRAKVNIIVGQAGVTAGAGAVAANTPRMTLASDDPAVTALQVLDNIVSGNEAQVDIVTVPAPLSTTGGGTEATALRVTVASDSTGVLSIDDNGGSLTVDNGGTFAVQPGPSTAGGLSIFRSIDLDESEEEVKGTAGQVYGWYIANLAATTRFVKFYNGTAASVTVGTTTPVMTLPIPGNSTDDIAANALGAMGIAFDTAITVAATTGLADSDTGAPSANDVVINVFYK